MILRTWMSIWLCASLPACFLEESDHNSGQGTGQPSPMSGLRDEGDAGSPALVGGDGGQAQSDLPRGAEGGGSAPGRGTEAGVPNTEAGADRGDASAALPGATTGLDAGNGFDSGIDTSNPTVNHPSVRLDGGVTPVEFDAGPILNPEAQSACAKLADAICTQVADCDQQVVSVSDAQRATAFNACEKSFQRAHNCNRATAVASDFAACVESVKSIDCRVVFLGDISSRCVDKLTLQP